MIVEDKPYRMGVSALLFMIGAKLKYPSLLILAMAAVTFFVKGARFVHVGWVFTVLLSITLCLTAIPEYLGLGITVGAKVVKIRFGILSPQEVTIPYRKIATVTAETNALRRIFGLSSLIIATKFNEDIALPLIRTKLALEIQKEIESLN